MKSFYHYQRQDSMSFGVKTPFDKYKLPSTVSQWPMQEIEGHQQNLHQGQVAWAPSTNNVFNQFQGLVDSKHTSTYLRYLWWTFEYTKDEKMLLPVLETFLQECRFVKLTTCSNRSDEGNLMQKASAALSRTWILETKDLILWQVLIYKTSAPTSGSTR